MSFRNDLKKGQESEIEFARYLCTCPNFLSIELPKGKFKEWDIKMTTKDDKTITYEVKSDLRAHETGNFCIEYSCNGQASGIYSSKADYVVYHMMGRWFMQKRGELILRLRKTEKKDIKGGDGFRSGLWLLKTDTIPELFTELDLSNNGCEDETEE